MEMDGGTGLAELPLPGGLLQGQSGATALCHHLHLGHRSILLTPTPGLHYAEPLSVTHRCHQQMPTSALPQSPHNEAFQTPSCQGSDNVLEQRPSILGSTLGGVFQAGPPSTVAQRTLPAAW